MPSHFSLQLLSAYNPAIAIYLLKIILWILDNRQGVLPLLIF
jgi:hypothetical protein